jgi:hypothetical protein
MSGRGHSKAGARPGATATREPGAPGLAPLLTVPVPAPPGGCPTLTGKTTAAAAAADAGVVFLQYCGHRSA